MIIREHVQLAPYTTFGVPATARYFAEISAAGELGILFGDKTYADVPVWILGGGSNVLFTRDFDGLIVKIAIPGKKILGQEDGVIRVEVGAGEPWHDFVLYAIEQDWGGIENLSLIPGLVGGAPIQNIGAYGVEAKDVIDSVNAWDRIENRMVSFSNEACRFRYRDSMFKNEGRGRYIVTSVVFRLSTHNHAFNTGYDSLKDALQGTDPKELSLKKISEAVINIRRSKLPDPKVIGNAGSFFKNPVISHDQFVLLKANFTDFPGRETPGTTDVKVPAGWLIERAGWKGKRVGTVGVHDRQALVLVNYGGGDGAAILDLSKKIQQSVEEKFGIKLEPEVNIL